jgi:putative ABC transport system permease protein
MRVIIKALLISLIEKKARTFLVLFSIAVSAALIFANEAFSTTVSQRFYDADTRWSGYSDFIIEPRQSVGAEEWIDPAQLAKYSDTLEYSFSFIQEKALYMPSLEQMHYFSIIGADIAEFNRHNPVTLAQGSFDDWGGNKIIVGTTYANEYGFKLNDTIRLELNNAEYDFTIAGISEVKGMFLREFADGGFILAPKETVSQIFQADTNLVFLKMKDRSGRVAFLQQLTQDFPDFSVRYGINDEVIAAETQNSVMPFQVSSIVVIFMCMFIIYTAFHLVTLERIPIVGVLRSVGCTRKRINLILIVESACLGAVGGFFGCFLGLLVLMYIKSIMFTGEEAVINTTVNFGTREVLTAIGAAVIITAVSAVMPILRLTKTPIKAIILNDLGSKESKRSLWWIVGLLLMAACLVVPPFLQGNFTGMIIAVSLATGALVGLVPLAPFLTRHLSRLAGRLPFLPHDVVLGIRNIRDNSSLMNNIQLFSASIAIVAFMASMFGTMGHDLLLAFTRDMTYDVSVVLRHSDQDTLKTLNAIEGVEASAGYLGMHTAVLNHDTFMNALYGIDNPDFFNFNGVQGLENAQVALAGLNDGKHIVTTNLLKGKLGLNLGDKLMLQFGSDQAEYTITGFVDTNLGIGHAGFISSENYRADMGVADYNQIYVKGSVGQEQLKNNILRALGKEVMSIKTKDEFTQSNADKVIGIFTAINTYCYVALLVGIIGIVNNLIASFIERKRSFAMYRCVGMSKRSLNRMLMAEAVGMGVLGVSFGILCALVMSSSIPAAVTTLWGKVTLQLAVKEMVIIAVVGIVAMLAISAIPVMRSKKMSLIETIKYE